MDRYKETFDAWNNMASAYQDKFMNLDLYNKTYDHFCNEITKPNAKLLDIGCGPGNISKYLLSKRPDFNIVGIDIAPNMVALAKKNNPSARYSVMNIRQIHKLDTKYDGIVGGFCLPYLSEAECTTFILHSYELLHKNGILYLSFVEGDSSKSGFREGNFGRVYFYFHQLKYIHERLVGAQYSKIKSFKIDYIASDLSTDEHIILTATKQ